MRSIQQLMAARENLSISRQKLQAAAITDTSTTQISEFQGTKFTQDIYKFGEDYRFLQNAVNIDKSIVGTRDKTVRLYFTTSHLAVTKTHTEGAERTYTEMTNLDSVDATPTWDLGAIAISKEIAKTCSVELIELAKYMIAQDGEKQVEAAIVTAIEGATTNAVYGGDATSAATLETGDTITPDLMINGKGLIRNQNFKPMWFFINPEQETDLTKYTDFKNADEYGGREVVLNGEIGKFVGLKTIVTTNVNAKTVGGDSWGADGHLCFALGQNEQGQNAVTLAWKEELNYNYEYLPRFANHYIYRDACYAAVRVLEKAISLIHVTDA